jgi:hypothetical protein
MPRRTSVVMVQLVSAQQRLLGEQFDWDVAAGGVGVRAYLMGSLDEFAAGFLGLAFRQLRPQGHYEAKAALTVRDEADLSGDRHS